MDFGMAWVLIVLHSFSVECGSHPSQTRKSLCIRLPLVGSGEVLVQLLFTERDLRMEAQATLELAPVFLPGTVICMAHIVISGTVITRFWSWWTPKCWNNDLMASIAYSGILYWNYGMASRCSASFILSSLNFREFFEVARIIHRSRKSNDIVSTTTRCHHLYSLLLSNTSSTLLEISTTTSATW